MRFTSYTTAMRSLALKLKTSVENAEELYDMVDAVPKWETEAFASFKFLEDRTVQDYLHQKAVQRGENKR